jgi:hypothetical protein
MGVPVRVDPADLVAMSHELARVRAQLLGARRSLLGPVGDAAGIGATDHGIHPFVDRCQRGLVEVAADLDFVVRALVAAAATWQQTERSISGACR